jgi:hypothetical protein
MRWRLAVATKSLIRQVAQVGSAISGKQARSSAPAPHKAVMVIVRSKARWVGD